MLAGHRYGNLLVDEQENVKRVQLATEYLDGSASLAGGRQDEMKEAMVGVCLCFWSDGCCSEYAAQHSKTHNTMGRQETFSRRQTETSSRWAHRQQQSPTRFPIAMQAALKK